MDVTFDSANPDPKGLIAHFNKATDFTLALIDKAESTALLDTAGLDIVTISMEGEAVDISGHLASDKVTIVDFYADWCVPCKVLEKKLVAMMREDEGIALRKVNIVDWGSAVAKQHLKGVDGIPFVIIYDGSGKELYRGNGLIEQIKGALAPRG